MKIKEVKLNEYDWMSIFKGVNDYGSAALRRGSGETTTGRRTQEIFIKDFMNDAVTGLESAIQSGLVDVPQTNAQPSATTTAPAQPDAQAEPAPTGSGLNYRNAVKAMRRQGMAVGENKLSQYDKLNTLFEAILEQQAVDDNAQTIDNWLEQFFTRYMRNVDLTGKDQFIQSKAKEVANAIQQSKGSVRAPAVLKALQNFANLGYSLSVASAGAPRTVAQPVAKQTAQPTTVQQPQAAPAVQANYDDVEAALAKLGYSATDIKAVLPKLTPGASVQDNIVQALKVITPTTKPASARKSSATKSPEVLASRILKNLDTLKQTSPQKYQEILQVAAGMYNQVPKDQARDDLAAARLARQQAVSKAK